jgi:hypothetical protein
MGLAELPGRYNFGHVKESEGGQNDRRPETASRAAPEDAEPMLYCPVCSTRLIERKCKLFCERCGYYLSCADYY